MHFFKLQLYFSGCKKDVTKLENADLYGAWTTEVSDNETRMMLFMETNTIYPGAAASDGIVIFVITKTDTTIGFQGSYEIIEGYLKTQSGASEFANEILQFTKREFTLYTEASENNERVWSKTKTDWLTDNPLD